MCRSLTIVFMAVFTLIFTPAFLYAASDPDDDKGSKEHPMFSRLPGFYIDSYTTKQFEQYEFKDKKGNPVSVEGNFYEISLCVKRGVKPPSELQIIRNHTNAIKKIGGEVVFENNKEAHCMLKKSGMETWVKIYPWNQGECYTLYIIEKQVMVQDVMADAAQMARDIKDTGKVALYGIYFDTNKAEVKKESEPALKEIAKLLKENPTMKIYVVGHTDSDGNFDHNDKLSEARAKSVVKELTAKYGIAANRMAGYGVGPLCPVQSNKSKDGKAKNRRVELVEQ
ncbi:MAG: OmpA family protein [Spirochaetota bacterium]